jgi:hypothetical protein
MESHALVQNDAVVLGLLALILGFVFYTEGSAHPFWKKFYTYVPGILLCYVLPSLLSAFGIVDPATSQINSVASQYLLPATLVLLTISVDLKAILGLGYKALLLFLTGTVGVVFGGPLAMLLVGTVSPDVVGGVGPDAVWRGMGTLAGSWIGGAANQMALKEVFEPSDRVFAQIVAVDIMVQSVWMAFLLYLAGRSAVIDARTGADTSAIDELRRRVEAFHDEHARNLTTRDVVFIIAVGFGVTGPGGLDRGVARADRSMARPAEPDQLVLLDRLHRHRGGHRALVHAGQKPGGGGSLPRGDGNALHPDCVHRTGDGRVGDGQEPRAVRGGRRVDGVPRHAPVHGREARKGAALLRVRGKPGEHRRRGVRSCGGVGIPPDTRARGGGPGRARLCDRHLRGVALWARDAGDRGVKGGQPPETRPAAPMVGRGHSDLDAGRVRS